MNDDEDLSSVSGEFTAIARTFAERGNEVVITSPTDIKDGEINNIRNGTIMEDFDRVFVLCGSFQKDFYGDSVIARLRRQAPRLDFIITDYKLLPTNIKYIDFFDNIYALTSRQVLGKNIKYCGSNFILYKHKPEIDIIKILSEKTINYSFGGTERNRLADFLEYVWRPDCTLVGKSDTLGFDNRVSATKYRELLKATKFSIVISDTNHNINGFAGQRHWENLKYNIISFTDTKCDIDELIMKKDDWRRVKNYIELKEKMNYLLQNPKEYEKKLREQQEEIKEEYLNGDYIYRVLEGEK